MGRTSRPKPTDAELAILQVLWKEGHCTVRAVHEVVARRSATGYTTTLKLMQIMVEKGLVTRDESSRTHVYRARANRARTQRQMVGNLVERAFEGSAKSLIMQALSARKTSAAELAEIREVLDSLQGGSQ